MRFGICAPYQEVATLETYPFDYLEENVQRFLLPERPQQDFEEAWLEARKLPVPIEAGNSLLLADMRLVATPTQSVDTKRLERYMKTALQRAEQVGIRIIVFGTSHLRICSPGLLSSHTSMSLKSETVRLRAAMGKIFVPSSLRSIRLAMTAASPSNATGKTSLLR